MFSYSSIMPFSLLGIYSVMKPGIVMNTCNSRAQETEVQDCQLKITVGYILRQTNKQKTKVKQIQKQKQKE